MERRVGGCLFWFIIVAGLLLLPFKSCLEGERVSNPYPPGTRVRLGQSSLDQVGLWLLYEDECNVDVINNFVPSGTVAILAGPVCDDHGKYFKVTLDPDIRAKSKVYGENLWVAETDFSVVK